MASRPVALNAKLRIPQPPARTVTRARLLDRLRSSRHRVILVSGPAGFGKTVLVTDWLGGSGRPHAWLSLDNLDNDPKRFLANLAAAFDTLDAEPARRAAQALRSMSANGDVARERALLEPLHEIDAATVLVLDDVHVLDGGRTLDLIAGLLEACAAGPRLVLLTRTTLPLPLGRMRVADELFEVREDDLRFTLDEAAALFAAHLPGGLESELVARLEERTEGWAAGLRLAAIALEQSPDRRSVVDAFSGSHRFVADYLLEEALAHQADEVRRFLMETSIMPRFTADACVAVTGDAAAGSLLRHVEAANLFLVPLGSDRQWYRYHQLVAELLQFRLRRLHPGRLDELHERASRWYEEQGDVAAAAEQASRCASREHLAGLIDRHTVETLARSEMASLARWLQHVPEPVRNGYPWLLLGLSWIRVLSERAPDLDPLFDAAAGALDNPPAGYDEQAVAQARLELDVLRAYHARFSGRFDSALSLGADVLDRLGPDGTAVRGRILYNQARVYMMLGEMARAAPLLELSIAENLRAGTHYLVLSSLGQTGSLLLETEGVPRARLALEAAVRLAEDRKLTGLPAFSTVLFQLGNVLTVADELDAAAACFERALALGSQGDMPDAKANGLVGLARLRAAQGRFVEADRLLLEAEAMARTTNLGLIECDVGIPRRRHASYRAAAGLDAAPPPVSDAEPAGGRWTVLDEGRDMCRVTEALRSAAPEARADAAAAIRRLLDGSARSGRRIAGCVARVADALIGSDARRWATLDDALVEAAARGYVRPLLELGPPLLPLLQAALSQPISQPARRFARMLIARMDRAAGPAAHGSTDPATAPTDRTAVGVTGAIGATGATGAIGGTGAVGHGTADTAWPGGLTDREREVLVHLCRGLSNKAIARSMYVSPETVKTHIRHVYDKLNVGSRTQAVARARALNLVQAHQLDG